MAATDESTFTQLFDAGDLQPFHQNGRYAFYRVARQNAAFVIKSVDAGSGDAGAIASLRHECELLRGLDLPGIVKVAGLARTATGLALVMHDAGSQTLAGCIGAGLPVAGFLEVAPQLAQSVAALHDAGIMHRNLNPANVVWDAQTRTATLVDFGIAIALAGVTVDSTSPGRLEGDLAYIAPEQTGRTGRSVDARSDLYALGAIFYALLTGAPPFTAQDPVELVHAHLARRPRPPHAINPDIPPLLSSIVLKLLDKEPERRYQTAAALAADLRTARERWAATQTLEPFALAQHDTPRQLTLPDKLYGRERETRILRDALERACSGQRELALVVGEPGIGKSALVRHLDQAIAERHGYFIGGKFDLLQRSVPYSGLVQAFRALVLQLLAEPDTALAAWRERILAALAPNGRILLDLIPEIEGIIGQQASVAELGPIESKNRFNQVFTTLVDVFARPEHPFVLFLDDLQWADAASLQLIEGWTADRDSASLLIIGAYRDNEIGPAHPLARTLAELRAAGMRLPEVRLDPLAPADVVAWLSDALQLEPEHCSALAGLVVEKTAGNPFFIRRLLHSLHHDGLIRFDAGTRTWRWDVDEIGAAPVSDNVLDLMVQTIGRLPEATRQLLQAGACIGHRFELGTLADLTGQSRTSAMNALWPALEDGLLQPLRDAYKAPRHAGPRDHELAALPVTLRFVHDRVQQAAYSLLDDARRQALHLEIGRQLLRRATEAELEARLFDVVDQLDLGEALIADPAERLRLARLNLAAGRKAKTSSAYQAAFDYLHTGRRQLPADAWTSYAALAWTLHRELAESAYLAGRHAEAERMVEAVLAHAPSKIARAELYSLRVLAATVAGDWNGALRWGREGLDVFGHAWPLEGLAQANDAEAAAVMQNIGARRIGDLVGEPEVEDEEIRASMHLLSILGPPAYFSGSEVLTFLVTRSTNLSLRHGPSVYSAYAYVFHGALHNARTGQYDVGYEFGKLALALALRFGNRAEESRTLEVFGLVVHSWCAPVRASLPLMQEGHRAGVESGELAYAAFNLCGILINGLPAGLPLDGLLDDAAISIDFATRHQNRTAIEISLPFRQFARALTGRTRSLGSFDDADFDQARFINEASGNQTAMGQFWVARLQAALIAGDLENARHAAHKGEECIQSGILGMVTSSEHTFYTALMLAVRHAAASAPERDALAGQVRSRLAQLVTWAGYCPENFLHKRKLVEAELERIAGAQWSALTLYEEAIASAHRNGFVQDAALGNELAGRFCLAQGQPRLAGTYLAAASDCYRKWGASAKAAALDVARTGPGAVADWLSMRAPHGAPALALDALGLIKASQAIAAEHLPERLFERILQVVAEVAGAQRGVLLLGEAAALRVRARIVADEASSSALPNLALSDDPTLPASLVRYVARTREPLVLADAVLSGAFAGDPEVRALGLRSVLCVPLRKKLRVMGVLYLENKVLADAFTADRVQVVQALAAQAVISLENSSLLLERERAERSARFLAGAGAALVESLEHANTVARVVDLAVPAFADWCILDLVGADGEVHRAQVAFANPDHADLANTLKRFPPRRARHRHPMASALHGEEAILMAEISQDRLRTLSHDDEHYALAQAVNPRSLIAVPLVARGRTLGVLTFILSESDRRYDQADLALASELADRCALALDNAALYTKAQEAVRVREDFLAVASHELKTPLTPLLLQIHLIERRLPSLIEDEQNAAWLARGLATLQRQGKRLDRLVNELLDISRIAGGQLQLKPEPVRLGEVVDDVVGRLEEGREILQSGSRLAMHGDWGISGHWDRLRLDQVITNLLSNALKYGEGKPVELTIRVAGPEAVIAVSDQGMGIEPDNLDRIFGRFERAVSARQYGGLGLGLYIASQIIAAMDGSIEVASTLGQGSTFTVRLPLAPALPSPTQEAP